MQTDNNNRGSWMVDLSLMGLIGTGIGGLCLCVAEFERNEVAAAIALVASALAFGFVVSSAFRK